jgi:hypothetical protein
MIRVKPSIVEMDFVNDNDNGKEEDEEPITLIVDASGLTVSRKGHYIEQKWNTCDRLQYRWGCKIQESK